MKSKIANQYIEKIVGRYHCGGNSIDYSTEGDGSVYCYDMLSINKAIKLLLRFEDEVRRDQHEKSCRAQREKCDANLEIKSDIYGGCYVVRSSIFAAPLADFNDTITE